MIRHLSSSFVNLSLIALATACGCQGSADSFYSGMLSTPSQLASGLASRTQALRSDWKLNRSTRNNVPDPQLTEESYAGVQLAMGQSFEKDGNLESAEAAYQAALRNDPSVATAYHRLALIKEKTGRGNESLAHFQSALKLDPDNPEIHCDVGYCYYLRRNWDEAEQHLRRATELDPRLARAHNNLALVLARTDRSDAAMQHFARAGLTAAEAHTNLGFVHLTDQRFTDARSHLNRAIAAEPEARGAHTLLASLNSIAVGSVSQNGNVNLSTGTSPTTSVRPEPEHWDPGHSDVADSRSNSTSSANNADTRTRIRLAQFDNGQESLAQSPPSENLAAPAKARQEPDVSAFVQYSPVVERSLPTAAPRRTPSASQQVDDAPIVFGRSYGEHP